MVASVHVNISDFVDAEIYPYFLIFADDFYNSEMAGSIEFFYGLVLQCLGCCIVIWVILIVWLLDCGV